KYIREIGHNLYAFSYAHTVRIDREDNIWTVDKGSDMVVKFNPAGRVQMVFGRKKEASDEAVPWTRVTPPRPHVGGHFRQPTDVPVPADALPAIGNRPTADTAATQLNGAPWAVCIPPGSNVIYMSDAYPGRIYKLTLDGKVLGVLGKAGKQPKQFGWIHEMACPSENELYVAEIVNWRVQKLILHPERVTRTSN